MDNLTEIFEIAKRLRALNIVAYSGGKDSTSSLQLILEAMESAIGFQDRLLITTSDTLMEIPFYQEYVDKNRITIEAYLKAKGVNAELVTLTPKWEKSFWVCTLGKGYPSSHDKFKWCTQQLKIDPINEFMQSMAAVNADHMIFVGVRQAESARREKTYRVPDFMPNHYAPILYWDTQDVWTYLLTEPCPWGNHEDLVRVYKYASDECVYGAEKNICIGNARYGCWICPLQKNTQLKLISSALNDDRYFLLKKYKDAFQAMANNWTYRSCLRRDLHPGVGPFLVPVRQELYYKLKELEKETGWRLIRPEEEALIFKHWEIDGDIHVNPNLDRPTLFPWGEFPA